MSQKPQNSKTPTKIQNKKTKSMKPKQPKELTKKDLPRLYDLYFKFTDFIWSFEKIDTQLAESWGIETNSIAWSIIRRILELENPQSLNDIKRLEAYQFQHDFDLTDLALVRLCAKDPDQNKKESGYLFLNQRIIAKLLKAKRPNTPSEVLDWINKQVNK